jgi:hypothetical protein
MQVAVVILAILAMVAGILGMMRMGVAVLDREILADSVLFAAGLISLAIIAAAQRPPQSDDKPNSNASQSR